MKAYCNTGKHWAEEKDFSKSKLQQKNKICIGCRKKYWLKTKEEKEKEKVYDSMFFDFTKDKHKL